MTPIPDQRSARAFTLVEVALAITIVAVVVLAAIGLLLPSQRAIDDVLTGGQATRLRQEIEKEYAVLRPTSDSTYKTSFEKAYDAVKNGKSQNGLLCAFFYRGTVGTTLDNGRLSPFTDDPAKKEIGKDYVPQAAVMKADEFSAKPFIDALEGRLFVVRLLALEGLVSDTSANLPSPMKPLPAATGNGTPLDGFLAANTADAYPLAVLPAAAEFYVANDADNPANMYQLINDGKVKPVITLNVGFNR